ncbi:MAG: hypothetical protein DWQ42_19725 [Planctomycetota bacterium]|nr:MAG: hypothetical protein DWQ42_19725 [Planctomycetota bacterium]REK39485.1 MAG: hypothetical protein DWQ46_19780 [Planctomycetota bacterium]
MNAQVIERQFKKIGARAKINADAQRFGGAIRLDIGHDRQGEFFDVGVGRTRDLCVADAQPRIRHLLLVSRQNDGNHKFLCGHDERHWFVAAVPERITVSSVQTAFEALKPAAVLQRQEQLKVNRRKRNRRRNEAFVRQGEWFFVPLPEQFRIDERLIFRNEPISRGRGKPHICEELVRQGGELVYVSGRHPNGLTEAQYRKLLNRRPELRKVAWVAQRRNPQVYVRGKIRHSDHKTIVLNGWHQVLMNTETQSVAMRHVAFID